MGEEKAWANKTYIYLGSAACAEFIADIFLCPYEAIRIRSVSDPEFCDGVVDGFGKILKADGIGGLYAGLLPMLFKQIPYTMAKFAVQGEAADKIYASMGKTPDQLSSGANVGISLTSGVIAGVAAAIISHPADTLLSKINKAGAGGDGPTMTRLLNIAKETGFVNLCTVGLLPRCVMVGTLTAGQFGIYDTVMNALGASKHCFQPLEAAGFLSYVGDGTLAEGSKASPGISASGIFCSFCSCQQAPQVVAALLIGSCSTWPPKLDLLLQGRQPLDLRAGAVFHARLGRGVQFRRHRRYFWCPVGGVSESNLIST
ncbi:hypothetical protein THAOC_18613 [Thalassiosira oceanica]|uniref:Mitochondrial phosphate carrier protein n=1 Tax=Thalassiosira oceanica TaxID=159749 RepID=K0SRK2_THAOC|nr:hypothetical protein THAOC_18613 [Thalassiosira oceanica]|eukprot:EJK60962.1 hypothetical protein THAOC_18613 [Thalassiosira oceanica]